MLSASLGVGFLGGSVRADSFSKLNLSVPKLEAPLLSIELSGSRQIPEAPASRISVGSIMSGQYGLHSPFVAPDGRLAPAATGVVVTVRESTPGKGVLFQIGGLNIAADDTYLGIVRVRDRLLANGQVFKEEDFALLVHDHRLQVYRRDVNDWLAIDVHSWTHASLLGMLDFSFIQGQASTGLGLGISVRPSREEAARGTVIQASVSAGPGLRFEAGEGAGAPGFTGAYFFNLTAIR